MPILKESPECTPFVRSLRNLANLSKRPELNEAFSVALRLALPQLANLQENLGGIGLEQRNRYVREFVRRVWESEFPPLPELKYYNVGAFQQKL